MDIDQHKSIELLEGSIDDLKFVYKRFEREFAAKERKDYQHLISLINGGKYKLFLAKDRGLNHIVGYAFVYKIDYPLALWLDYIAIDVPYQNLGYGTLLFNKIIEYCSEFLGLFLEVEIPDKENFGFIQQLRRIKFYERLGARKLAIHYKCPTVHDGLPMYLYFWPSPCTLMLHKEQIQAAITAVFDDVHSDQPYRSEVLKSFYSTIEDICFSEPFV
jgi:GNAT superfamily N-acetyltransferase